MKINKKILLFSHEYPPCLGGAGTVAFTLKNGLEDRGYDVTVLTSRRSLDKKSLTFNISPLPSKLWFLGYYRWLNKYINNFDVIFCNDPAAIYNAGKYLSSENLKKIICIVHGEEKYLNENKFWLRLIGFRKSFERALYHSKLTIFVSKYIKERYLELYNINLKEKSSIIHSGVSSIINPIDTARFDRNKSSKIKFLSVSRIVQGKGYDSMLEIFLCLAKEGLDFQWNIVGEGNYLATFKEKVRLSAIRDKVIFHGAVNRTELSKFYKNNDYYILLSKLNESYGLSYLEAASFGLTPIAYRRAGVPEAFSYITKGLLLDEIKTTEELASIIKTFVFSPDNISTQCLRSQKDFILEIECYV